MFSKDARLTTLKKKELVREALVGNMRVFPVISRTRQKHVKNDTHSDRNVTGFAPCTSMYFVGVTFNLTINQLLRKKRLSCFVDNT